MKTNNSLKSKQVRAVCEQKPSSIVLAKRTKSSYSMKRAKGWLQNMTSPVDKNKIQRESQVISEINSISQNNFNYSKKPNWRN